MAMKASVVILGVLAAGGLAATGYWIEREAAFRKADRATVAKVDKAVAEALGADAELTQRLGSIVRLDGSTYQRMNYTWMLIERIEMSRRAVFEKGQLDLKVIISCSQSRDLDELPVGHISWTADRSGMAKENFLEVSVAIDYRERYMSPEERTPRPFMLSQAALSPDTGSVYLGRLIDTVEVWSREPAQKVRDIKGSFGLILNVCQAVGSGSVLIDAENRLVVVDPMSGVFAAGYPASNLRKEGLHAGVSADGRLLLQSQYQQWFANGSGPLGTRMAVLHKIGEGTSTPLIVDGAVPDPAELVLLAPEGKQAVLILNQGRTMQGWDLESYRLVWTKEKPEERMTFECAAGFTPQTGWLCVFRDSYTPGAPEIYDPISGELEATLEAPAERTWKSFREASHVTSRPIIAVSPDERFLAVGMKNGRVLVWHLSTGKLAGLIYNNNWVLEASLANEKGTDWVDPPPQRPGYNGIIMGKPYRGENLAAIGFDPSNRLIGVSLYPEVARIWKAEPKWLRETKASTAPVSSVQ